MKTAKQVLEDKSPDIWTATSDALVVDAAKLMTEKEIGAVLVVDNDKVVGIVSERDCVREFVVNSAKELRVREIMTKQVVYIRPEQTSAECMALMNHKNIRHLPVMDGNELLGVISMKDVAKELIADQEFLIEQLENYIVGTQ